MEAWRMTCWVCSWPQKGRRLRRLCWVYTYYWRKWAALQVRGWAAVSTRWLLGVPSPARPCQLYWWWFYLRDLIFQQQRVAGGGRWVRGRDAREKGRHAAPKSNFAYFTVSRGVPLQLRCYHEEGRRWTRALAAETVSSLELLRQNLSRASWIWLVSRVRTWHGYFRTGHYQLISHCNRAPHYRKAVGQHSTFLFQTHHPPLSNALLLHLFICVVS